MAVDSLVGMYAFHHDAASYSREKCANLAQFLATGRYFGCCGLLGGEQASASINVDIGWRLVAL